jgi:hypothetical protein
MAEDTRETITKSESDLVKFIKATATFKSTYAKDESLLKAMLQNRFNKQSLDELSEYQLEELGKYLTKLDSYQVGKKELATKNQMKLIQTLWIEKFKKDNKAFDAYMKGLGALSKKGAEKLIEALKRPIVEETNGTK